MPIVPSEREMEIVGWVSARVQEGEAFLRQQTGFKEITKSIAYIQGDQKDTGTQSLAMSNFSSNLIGKVVTDTVASLTDVKPFLSYRTKNDLFKHQAQILNDLAHSWWINNFIDLKLGAGVQLAAPAGCAYLQLVFNPSLAGGKGDIDIIPRDCRDVFFVQPGNTLSCQDALAVIIRSVESVSYLRDRFPEKAALIHGDGGTTSWTERWGMKTGMASVLSPAMQALRPRRGNQTTGDEMPGKTIYTVYVRDDSKNTSGSDLKMGFGPDGERYSWSYIVPPGERKYPRGRMIICGDDILLDNGPSPYWHGEFPIHKLYMDMSFVYPNSFLSKSLTKDLIPHQDLTNEILNGIVDAVRKSLAPNTWFDARSVSEKEARDYKPRRAGQKLRMTPTSAQPIYSEPPPILPDYVFNMVNMLEERIEKLSGSNDMRSLMQLKQLPAAESVEAIYQALSPITRLRGRLLEYCVRGIAEQLKMNLFQFYSAPRRIAILGEDGLSFEDFDFDPGTLVPDSNGNFLGMEEEFKEYQLNTREERAVTHAKSFPFYVTPNSLLELALVSKKLLYLQLRREGEIDHTTLLEALEVPNISKINERLGSEIDQKIAALAQAQAGRAGRPPSGQVMPHFETKGDGRATVSES